MRVRDGSSDVCSSNLVPRLPSRAGRPGWWIKRRAAELGLAGQKVAPAEWTAAEIDLLREHAHKKPGAIAAILRRRGFQRTVTAVVVKTKRQALDRTDVDHFPATALPGVMGVDAKAVKRWIEVAGLEGGRTRPRMND